MCYGGCGEMDGPDSLDPAGVVQPTRRGVTVTQPEADGVGGKGMAEPDPVGGRGQAIQSLDQ